MGAICCGSSSYAPIETGSLRDPIITPGDEGQPSGQQAGGEGESLDREARRKLQADAALARAKQFQQGGGGERLKAKAKALEEAEKKNKAIGGPSLKWSVG